MAKKMIAIFSDEAYEDLKSGRAIDNNGFRSKKGNFHPDQPTYKENNEFLEMLKIEGVRFVADVAGALTFSIALPTLKRFIDEKIYPYFSEKWDTWRNQNRGVVCDSKILDKSDISQEEKSEKDKIINLEEYRKRA